MASFPTLKTGVVAQYPSDRARRFSTQVLRFLDGSEQRFAGFGAPLKRWLIRLELLDEAELAGWKTSSWNRAVERGHFHLPIRGMEPCTRTAVSRATR